MMIRWIILEAPMLLEKIAPYITPQGHKIYNQERLTGKKLAPSLHGYSPMIWVILKLGQNSIPNRFGEEFM